MNIKCIFTQVNTLYKLNYSSLIFIYSFLSIKSASRGKLVIKKLVICIGKQSVKIVELGCFDIYTTISNFKLLKIIRFITYSNHLQFKLDSADSTFLLFVNRRDV